LTLLPVNAADLTSFAQLCLHALDIDAATGALAQAEKLEPEYPELLATRALLSMYMGRFAAAETDCVRCLALDTSNASAAVTLSRVRRGRLADSELAIMRRVADDTSAHLDRRIPAAFTIAHALDSRRDYAAAFAAYQTAHAFAQQRDSLESRRFDASNLAGRRARILALDFSKAPPASNAARAPRAIFIVGMPRSGTTLVEAVIAAHPRVLGCGERITLPPVIDALVTISAEGCAIDGELLDEARRNYLAGLPNPGQADCFTDKQPFNFQAIGLIATMLPDAAIIYVRRNPIETCLSIYRQEFNKAWSFAHSLADIGAVYAHHALLMHEWQARLPARFMTIQYEDLVADFDGSARNLVAASGLEWHPDCLEFQRAVRPIATFSAVEVRGKVRSHNGRAANYQQHLAPLVAALTHYGVDLVSGAMVSAP
jgi:tetratricopeptide (TPR) repeat protein